MGFVFANGTFRVSPRSKDVPKNFSYSNRSSTVKNVYANSQEMWEDRIDWGLIKSKLMSSLRGTSEEASFIKSSLLQVEQAITKGDNLDSIFSNAVLPEEKEQLLQELREKIMTNPNTGETTTVANSLLTFQDSATISSDAIGKSLEHRLGQLFDALITGGSSDILSGTQQVFTGVKMSLDDLGLETCELKLDKDGKLTEGSRKKISKSIEALYGGTWRELMGAFSAQIVKDGNGNIKDVLIRNTTVSGKADLNNTTEFEVRGELTPRMKNLARLLGTRSFSLKNYNFYHAAKEGVSLGHAVQQTRVAGSFYLYGNSKGEDHINLADTCTFLFASENSHRPVVKKYLSWMRFLYEGLGIGQEDSYGNNTLVDFILINLRKGASAADLNILATRSMIEGMPNSEPNLSFQSADGQINLTV